MKSFNQFCSEAIYFIEMSDFSAGGGNAKMRQTGMTRDQVIALGRKNLARLNNKPAASAPKPAATGVSGGAAPASRTVTTRPAPAASPAPAPRPRDERPTVGQVQAAKREAEYQRNARNLRLGVELGGVAKLAAQQAYSNQNSVVARGGGNQAPWRTHPHTLNKKVGRGYGVPKFSDTMQYNTQSQLTDYYMKKGMSSDAANAKAAKEAQQIHDRNRADYRSGSGYD